MLPPIPVGTVFEVLVLDLLEEKKNLNFSYFENKN